MSGYDTVRRISEVLRAAREPGAALDPTFFDRKAAVYDLIADDDPTYAAEARRNADQAHARARELRSRRTR